MGLTVASALFIVGFLAFFLYVGYYHKNVFMVLLGGILSIVFGVMIWIAHIVEETGNVIAGSITSGGVSLGTTYTFSVVNFGFSQNYLAIFFVLVGLFFFLQSIGVVVESYREVDS